jgi:chromosome partitioning protein
MANDPLCLARLKHYQSLVSMAQEAKKPIFQLTAADGAIGSHSSGMQDARKDFYSLAQSILDRMNAKS